MNGVFYILNLLLFNIYSIFLFIVNVQATISKDFSNFLIKEYGEEVEKLIARRDLGFGGSFGGGQENEGNNRISKRRPIIFVHGLTNVAGTYEYIRRYFLTKGYNNSELYATTYSYGVKKFLKDKMECRHITQVNFIN
uniref:Triacylglycerol lipase n=1 Tax=Meloidogyne incognita TaxID=6306 RepID=A0A914NVA7_MELIC